MAAMAYNSAACKGVLIQVGALDALRGLSASASPPVAKAAAAAATDTILYNRAPGGGGDGEAVFGRASGPQPAGRASEHGRAVRRALPVFF